MTAKIVHFPRRQPQVDGWTFLFNLWALFMALCWSIF